MASKKFVSRKKKANIDNLITHIDYIAELIGVEYIGIGTDFGGSTSDLVEGLESVNNINNLFDVFRKKGCSQKDIEKIGGGNLLRIVNQIIEIARILVEDSRAWSEPRRLGGAVGFILNRNLLGNDFGTNFSDR